MSNLHHISNRNLPITIDIRSVKDKRLRIVIQDVTGGLYYISYCDFATSINIAQSISENFNVIKCIQGMYFLLICCGQDCIIEF